MATSTTPSYAGFDTLEDALAFRPQHGGWVFASDCGKAVWFSLKFTPSKILGHTAIRGMDGKLI